MKNKFVEMFKFLVNGGICFIIEYILMILFTEKLGIYYLLSSVIAFLISTIINYIICVVWVFNIDKDTSNDKKIKFLLTSFVALALNQLIMYLGVSILTFNYKIMKIVATGIVTIVNYFLKKKVLVGKII